ncbi:type VI secretion system Vgr family protein [Pseudogemmobacter humi]|uniref:Phage-related baseplate assembly protein n=1 Tax=Pseudogemmobacter humi TaxID=2483812 RepID=A0A3P5XDH6_9RHOB|nr:type VI secretion system tip protein TssI/VgrG [Pseudogemmobacter humi]VDC32775.1 Phage-related baseplate assembly protein [Pseudogemmobacter humi]
MKKVELLLNVTGDGPVAGLEVRRALVTEGLNRITAVSLEVLGKDRSLSLGDFVGKPMALAVAAPDGSDERRFAGLCISAEYLGTHNDHGRYLMEVRSRFWLLGRSRECRVFQGRTTPQIVQDVLTDYGLSGNLKNRLTQSYEPRDYCLQFRESDLDFLSRLMEEEGISYYFTHDGKAETMVLADEISGHDPLPGDPLEYSEAAAKSGGSVNRVSDLRASALLTTGKVTLGDHNFEKSNPKLTAVRALPKGGHGHKDYEAYIYPGRYRESGLGEARARVVMEAEAARHATLRGITDARHLTAGATAKIKGHAQLAGSPEYLITLASHYFQADALEPGAGEGGGIELPPDMGQKACLTKFEVIPKAVPFRPAPETPWPEIPGVLTALVVGPKDDEIHTDKYGRVRVQFFWDRLGKSDEKAGVFVRVAQPWTGKNWGMQSIPRIGQEVLVGFENGDPDRPIILGMLYNANTMPPWPLPDNQTRTGLRTNSSKGGGGYNELMFEDKKGKELVHFQAERDYEQKVKNNATVTVGLEHKTEGDMTVTIHRNLTETLKTGDHTFTVASGNQKIGIKKDKTEGIEGKSALTVKGDSDTVIEEGNLSETVKTGDMSQLVQMGNFSLKTSLGKVEIEAMQEILLKVGANSIKIDQTGVTVNGTIVKIEGTAMLEAKAPVSNIKGDGVLILKGGVTMIN